MLPRLPSSMHAGATTPAGAVWCMCRFSSQTAIGLPLTQGGSAPALPVSRPARRSLHAPACMVAELLNAALLSGVLQSMSLPPRTAPAATSRKDSCWVGFAPTRKTRLSTAHLGLRLSLIQTARNQIIRIVHGDAELGRYMTKQQRSASAVALAARMPGPIRTGAVPRGTGANRTEWSSVESTKRKSLAEDSATR